MGDLLTTNETPLTLVQTPLSEVMATLERLSNYGVGIDDLRAIRRDKDLAMRIGTAMFSRVTTRLEDPANSRWAKVVWSDCVEVDYRRSPEQALADSSVRGQSGIYSAIGNVCGQFRMGRALTFMYVVRLKGNYTHIQCLELLDEMGLVPAEFMQGLACATHLSPDGRLKWPDLRFPGMVFRIPEAHNFYTFRICEEENQYKYCLNMYDIRTSYSNVHVLAVPQYA